MARPFDVKAVEAKWQDHWAEEGTYEVDNDDPRERFFALCMYPYPSGAAHRIRLLRPAGRERRHQGR